MSKYCKVLMLKLFAVYYLMEEEGCRVNAESFYFGLFTACGHWWATIFTVQHFSPWATIFFLSHVSIFQFASAQSRLFPFIIDYTCC